ncbi:MAG: VTT domain-containing protein, partial [Planctomycetota bacterium]
GLLRLSPAIPFNLQNYLFGLTKVRFWPYMAISWIAMMPGTFLYVYLGHIAGVASGGGGSEGDAGSSIGKWVLLGVGLLATVAVSVYVTRLAQRKLRESESRDESTNDDQDPPNESRNNTEPAAPVSGGTALLWASVAAVMLSVAIIAQFQRDAIASYLGVTPQAVEIQSPEKE